jgi:hypothetical protein
MDKLTKYLLITLGIIITIGLVRMYVGIPFFSIYHKGDVKITTTCYGSDASSFRCPTTYSGYTVSECDVYSYTTAVLNPGEYCSYPQCKYSGGVCIEIWGYPTTTTTTSTTTSTTTTTIPKICTPGSTSNYRCDGAYKVWDVCSSDGTAWITQRQYCQYGCLNGECIQQICNPGEKKNFRCDGNYKAWEECSPDGKSWFTNREYCNYGCFNGECNQYIPTTTTTQPIVQPQPTPPTTTTLPTQEQPQPIFDYRLIPIIIGVILVIVISVFLLIRGKKYG